MYHVAIQRSDAMRAKFMAEISVYDTLMLIWLDAIVETPYVHMVTVLVVSH